jgi:photosystem II stability/assembly factor-like uncharacterized protein
LGLSNQLFGCPPVTRRSAVAVCILSIALVSASADQGVTQPTWTSVGPGGGGWIMTAAASPFAVDRVFLGGDTEGIFYSENSGATWSIRNEGLRDYWIETILSDPTNPNNIYAGGRSGVYKSTDAGRSWRWLRTGFPPVSSSSYSAPVSALAMDPANPQAVYAGIGSPRTGEGKLGAVYRTTDGGDNWARVNSPGSLPPDALVTSLVFHPSNQTMSPGQATARTLYMSSQYGFHISTDGGVSWNTSNTGLPHTNVARIALSRNRPEVMYLTLYTPLGATWQGGVYRSGDGGRTWVARNNGLRQLVGAEDVLTSNYKELAVDPNDPNIVYVGATDYRTPPMHKTTDGGSSWTAIVTLPTPSSITDGWGGRVLGYTVQALSMSPLDSRVLYYGTGMAVFRTNDSGLTWQSIYTRVNADGSNQTTGLELTHSRFITVDPRNPRRVFSGYMDIGLFLSEDGGTTVQRKAGDLPYPVPASTAYAVALDPNDSQHLWGSFGPWETRPTGFVIAESTNLGRTWVMRKDGLPEGPYLRLLRDDSGPSPRLLVTASNNGIYRSDDGGRSWTASSNGLAHLDVRDVVPHPSVPGMYWCVLAGKDSSPAMVYRSDDRGATWQRLSDSSLQAWDVKQLVVSRVMYLAARRIFVGGRAYSGGVYSSEDGGISWKRALEDPFAQAVAVDPLDARVVYAGLTDHPYYDESRGNGLRMSRDGGSTWTDVPGLPQRRVTVLTVDPGNPRRLFVGTAGNGLGIVDFTSSSVAAAARRPPAQNQR